MLMHQLRTQKRKFLQKNKTFYLVISFLVILNLPGLADAAYFEPYIGNIKYDLNQDRTDTLTSELKPYKQKGTLWGGGLRYGPSFRPVFIGIDISYYLMNRIDQLTGEKNTESILLFGPTITYEFHIVPLRVLFGFNYIDRFHYSSAQTFSGTSLKLGVGVAIMPKVSFNAEMIRHRYSRLEERGGVARFPTTRDHSSYQAPSMTSLLLSLSFPFW